MTCLPLDTSHVTSKVDTGHHQSDREDISASPTKLMVPTERHSNTNPSDPMMHVVPRSKTRSVLRSRSAARRRQQSATQETVEIESSPLTKVEFPGLGSNNATSKRGKRRDMRNRKIIVSSKSAAELFRRQPQSLEASSRRNGATKNQRLHQQKIQLDREHWVEQRHSSVGLCVPKKGNSTVPFSAHLLSVNPRGHASLSRSLSNSYFNSLSNLRKDHTTPTFRVSQKEWGSYSYPITSNPSPWTARTELASARNVEQEHRGKNDCGSVFPAFAPPPLAFLRPNIQDSLHERSFDGAQDERFGEDDSVVREFFQELYNYQENSYLLEKQAVIDVQNELNVVRKGLKAESPLTRPGPTSGRPPTLWMDGAPGNQIELGLPLKREMRMNIQIEEMRKKSLIGDGVSSQMSEANPTVTYIG